MALRNLESNTNAGLP